MKTILHLLILLFIINIVCSAQTNNILFLENDSCNKNPELEKFAEEIKSSFEYINKLLKPQTSKDPVIYTYYGYTENTFRSNLDPRQQRFYKYLLSYRIWTDKMSNRHWIYIDAFASANPDLKYYSIISFPINSSADIKPLITHSNINVIDNILQNGLKPVINVCNIDLATDTKYSLQDSICNRLSCQTMFNKYYINRIPIQKAYWPNSISALKSRGHFQIFVVTEPTKSDDEQIRITPVLSTIQFPTAKQISDLISNISRTIFRL